MQLQALGLSSVGFASAVDLGDPTSPLGNVHFRHKQVVAYFAARLPAGTRQWLAVQPHLRLVWRPRMPPVCNAAGTIFAAENDSPRSCPGALHLDFFRLLQQHSVRDCLCSKLDNGDHFSGPGDSSYGPVRRYQSACGSCLTCLRIRQHKDQGHVLALHILP